MRILLKSTVGCALIGAVLALAAPALGDGRPETAPLPPRAAAQPQVAPAPSAAPLRAAPVQPSAAPAQPAPAAAPAAATAAPAAAPAAAAAPRTGAITLADGAVVVTTPAGFEFWPAAEAQAYLQRANAPAARGQVQGMLAPAGSRPTQANFWGTVVAYEPIGHVAADSAPGLQAASFEADVRAARTAEQRGFEGFAAQPAFDPAGASLSWAERSAATAANARDLRHEQRVLGRAGVVSLTTVARNDQLGAINAAAPDMLGSVAFPAGRRYADFIAQTDPASSYDLPGLITGRQSEVATAAGAQGLAAVPEKTQGAGIQGWFPWIAVGVVVLAVLGWFVMGRRNKDVEEDDAEADAAPAERAPDAPPATT